MSASQLSYLIEEICAAVEIYFTGRMGGQYFKTAFILCDDYTELTAKLFLLTDNQRWSDKKQTGKHINCASPTCGRPASSRGTKNETFKNYQDILMDVENVFARKRPNDLLELKAIHDEMKTRRKRRNDFFHSTTLLDLVIARRGVVEAFCDLFSYGELLLRTDWQRHVNSSRNLDTMRILLLIEKQSFSHPEIWEKVDSILRDWPRNKSKTAKKGVQVTQFPEDFHLRICINFGSNILRERLKAILTST